MTRRSFISNIAMAAAVPDIGGALRRRSELAKRKHRRIVSPKAAAEGETKRMVRIKAAPAPPPPEFVFTEAVPPFVVSIARGQGQVTLTWQNGFPPFRVFAGSSPSGPFDPFGNFTTGRTKIVPALLSKQFFRVQSSCRVTTLTTTGGTQNHITFTPPDYAN